MQFTLSDKSMMTVIDHSHSHPRALDLQLQRLQLHQILHVVGEHGLIEDVHMQLLSFLLLLVDDLVYDCLRVAEILNRNSCTCLWSS